MGLILCSWIQDDWFLNKFCGWSNIKPCFANWFVSPLIFPSVFTGNDDITLHSLTCDGKWIKSLPVTDADITDLQLKKTKQNIFFLMMNLCWAFHLMWHHRVGPHISNNRILSDPENRASPLSGADSRALAPLRLSTLALCLSHALRHSWAAAWAGCNVRLLSDSLFHTHTHPSLSNFGVHTQPGEQF